MGGGWKQPPSGIVDRLSATPSFPRPEYIDPPPPSHPSRVGLLFRLYAEVMAGTLLSLG